jgi:hypothetical protein
VRLIYPLKVGAALPPAVTHTCATQAAIEAGMLVEVQSLSTSTIQSNARVIGVVPDGVSAVAIKSTDGHTTVVPVIRNAFEAIVTDPAEASFYKHVNGRSSRERIALPRIPGEGLSHPPVAQRGGKLESQL